MYLMCVDESGDPGLANSPTRYFCLSGLVVHELRWQTTLAQIVTFRRRMKDLSGLQMREEIHAAAFVTTPSSLVRIKRYTRLAILRYFADELASASHLSIINILVDKQSKPLQYDVFNMAWTALIQRFENTMTHHNFPGPRNPDERGMIIADYTDVKKLNMIVRRMRHYNPVPSKHGTAHYRNLKIVGIIEDPVFRNSEHSYFIQAADLAAFFLYQSVAPNSYMRKKGGRNYLQRLDPILCKVASTSDPQGIVRL